MITTEEVRKLPHLCEGDYIHGFCLGKVLAYADALGTPREDVMADVAGVVIEQSTGGIRR